MTSQDREPIAVSTGTGGPDAFTDPVGMPTAGYAPSAEEAGMPVTPAYKGFDPAAPVSGGPRYRVYDAESIPTDERYAGSTYGGAEEGADHDGPWGPVRVEEDEPASRPHYRSYGATDPDRRGNEYDEPFAPTPSAVGIPRRGEKVFEAGRKAATAAGKAARFVVSKVPVPGKSTTAGEGVPTPPPAGGTPEAAPQRPRTHEEAERAYKPAIERLARAKRAEESGASITTKDARELDDSLDELRSVLDDLKNHEGWDDAKAIEESILAFQRVGERQIELSPDKVKVRFERARQVLGNILKSKKVRYILPAAIIATAVTVGALTGGAGAGVSAAIIGGAVKGGLIGGAVGGTIGGAGGAVQARAARAGRNTKAATQARISGQEDLLIERTKQARKSGDYDTFAQELDKGIYDLAEEEHRKNMGEKYKKIGGGVLRSGARGLVTGAIMGGAMGFAYHGLNGSEASAHSVADQGDSVEEIGQMAGTEGSTGTEGGNTGTEGGSTGTEGSQSGNQGIPKGDGSPYQGIPRGDEAGGATGTEGSQTTPEGPTPGDLTAEQINEAQTKIFEELLQNDPDKIKEMPGFENFNPEAATDKAAAHFNKAGDTLWGKLQNAGDMSDSETWKMLVGDGPNKGGLEELNANGFDINMGGEATMTSKGVNFNGDTWWIDSMKTPEDGVYVEMPNGNTFYYDGSLTQTEQAALLDQLGHGGEIVTPEALAEKLAAQVPDTQEALKGMADSVITEYSQEISAEIDQATENIGTTEVNPDVVEAQVQEAIEGYINEHGQALADLPENIKTEIATKVAESANMTPEAIKKMIDDAIEAANAASNVQTQRTLASAVSSV